MFVFSIFTFLVFGHQYNNSCSYNKQSLMSKSTRQIAHPKEFQRDASSFSNFPHKRGLSIEMRNFAQLLLKGKEHYKNNRMAEAIQVFTRGLYYDSNNLELNYWLGVSLMNVGNYSESLKYLKHVEKTNRLYRPNLLIMLAFGYKKMGHIQQSLSAVTEYITINENGCKDGLFYRAKIYKEMKDYGKVLDDLDAILIQNPQHTASMLLKVRVLIEKESEDQALSFLKVCKQRIHEPDKIQELYFEQIKINAKRGLFQESFQLMNKLQRLVPNPMPQCSLLKAKLHEKCGRKQEALMLYNELLAKNSSAKVFSEAIAQCAIICMRERDFYEALSYLKRTLLTKIKSKVTDQLFKLGQGLTFLMKKKYAEAIVLMGSCEINFKYELAQHVPYLQNLLSNALAYGNFSLGNHEAALQFYQKIMHNEPNTDSVAASYNICICEGIRAYQNGERDLALECFEKASNYILRPEPFFYTAVIMNEEFLKQPINTQGFVKILQLIEQGLKTGQNAHLFFYRATLYLFLGMHSQSLEDIDRAIEKSEDNVAKYFYTRGVIFMLDKNYEQAILQFTTAISIDDADQASITQKAKCELLTGDTENAFTNIRDLSRYSQLRTLFMLHEKQYRQIIGNQNVSETILQICRFMEGKFEEAGPSGKLVLAILYQNYAEVINLIDEAVTLGVPVGCLESNDLLILKAFSEYRLNRYEQSLLTLQRVQQALKQSNNRCDTYSQQDERKLLLCRFNVIITNFKRDHQLEALSLTESLLCQVCEGPIFDQLTLLKQYLTQGGQHQVDFGFDSALLSDFFGFEEQKGLRFKFLIPLPNYKVTQVQIPPYQQLLTHFSVADIENRPQAPWIKRGEFGVIFTNDIREFQNLNLKTEQNQAVKSRLPTGEQSKNLVRKRSQLIEYLKLSATILNKLDRITKKVDNVESS